MNDNASKWDKQQVLWHANFLSTSIVTKKSSGFTVPLDSVDKDSTKTQISVSMSQALNLRDMRMRIQTEDPLHYGKKKLKIQGRDLCNLPRSMFKLLELEVLDLSPERESCLDYKLRIVPSSIGKLINLNTLMLDTNDLEKVPVEITLLVNLERLALSNNQLTTLPNGFSRLAKLTSLHLANNLFELVPQEICELKALTFLDLSDNKLKILPHNISNLENLETLLLFINNLRKLPDTIIKMTELRCLWIGNNQISTLPKGFGYLTKLDWHERYTSSTLDGNPLVSPPIEICRMGPLGVERFQSVGPNIDKTRREQTKTLRSNEEKDNGEI